MSAENDRRQHTYHVGDKVRIRDDLIEDERYPAYGWGDDYGAGDVVNNEMILLAGKVATVMQCNEWVTGEPLYRIDLDNEEWAWYDTMFADEYEGLNDEPVVIDEADLEEVLFGV